MAELNIKKSKYYQVLKALNITAKKDLNKKAYLTNEQAQRVREFFNNSYSPQSEGSSNSSLQSGGLSNSPQSGGLSNSPQTEGSSNSSLQSGGANNSSLVKDTDSKLGSSSNGSLVKGTERNLDNSSNGSLVKTSEGELATPASQENIYVKPDEPTAGLDVNKLMRDAAELKARELAMGDLVKRSLADKMTYKDLPQDLKDCVDEAHQAANPDFFPQDIASQLLEQHRATV